LFFDYFKNEKLNEIKIGLRFIFQSKESTITDQEVDEVMQNIIDSALEYNSVSIPGLVK
jgi:Phenylalanyl-tRNA synthetase beta subunit